MILGRSTVQWLSLITALGGFLQVILPITLSVDPALLGVVIGASTIFLGGVIAFIANTSTTPSDDPKLKANTMVQVTDNAGTVIGHAPVPTPAPAPVQPDVPAGGNG